MLPLWQGKVFVWQPFSFLVVSYPNPPKFSPGGACGSEECKLGLFHFACCPFSPVISGRGWQSEESQQDFHHFIVSVRC